jgi:hypothetical protein
MKPYPNYKGNKLKNIVPTAIALVTEGANRKKFSLFKLNKEGSFMKKETALALVKSGNLTDEEIKLVLADVAEADRQEVQKAVDALKKDEGLDIEKIAGMVADKIVKAQSAQLTAIAESLKSTTTALEKMAAPAAKEEDKDLTDAEIKAIVEAEEK